jgi:hypothetical protein
MLLKDPRTNPSIDDNYPILIASKNNHIKVVKLLLTSDAVNPAVKDNQIILNAVVNGNFDLVAILLKHKKIAQSVDICRLLSILSDYVDSCELILDHIIKCTLPRFLSFYACEITRAQQLLGPKFELSIDQLKCSKDHLEITKLLLQKLNITNTYKRPIEINLYLKTVKIYKLLHENKILQLSLIGGHKYFCNTIIDNKDLFLSLLEYRSFDKPMYNTVWKVATEENNPHIVSMLLNNKHFDKDLEKLLSSVSIDKRHLLYDYFDY